MLHIYKRVNKRSRIWLISSEELKRIVSEAKSISSILRHFGLSHKGGNYKTLRARLNQERIDYNHIPRGYNANKGKQFYDKRTPVENLLVENGTETQRSQTKKKIIETGIIPYKCQICDQDPEWLNKPLVLVLDHINGVSIDYRKENLRFLCPNCNSQQSTFAGRNIHKKPDRKCKNCTRNITKSSRSGLCSFCVRKTHTKAQYPSSKILAQEASNSSYEAVGRKYGVTGACIKRRIQNAL